LNGIIGPMGRARKTAFALVKKDILELSDPEKAKILSRFFKTGKGEYGEGDIFLGIKVPELRKIAKKYGDLRLKETGRLLSSVIHEERLAALLILIGKFRKAGAAGRKEIVDLYLDSTGYVNNWDLVDISAPHILGEYLLHKDRSVLDKLAVSDSLWERRIAVITTFAFIRRNDFGDTLRIAGRLLSDRHDLIHKAVGWMLREVGKRDLKAEEDFLGAHFGKMPRTMLRYAIERFGEEKRRAYLSGKLRVRPLSGG
jgi:3-methyladenine DNA glycosylase AlkD